MKLKRKDVDYIYVDTSEMTFRVVLNDDRGEDIIVSSNNIELSTLAIDDLCEDVLKHIDDGGELIPVSPISFAPDIKLEGE
tara:strand:- start:535 stop:777 length:243 start_codon:yes stop_codon:yes gene_type:complete